MKYFKSFFFTIFIFNLFIIFIFSGQSVYAETYTCKNPTTGACSGTWDTTSYPSGSNLAQTCSGSCEAAGSGATCILYNSSTGCVDQTRTAPDNNMPQLQIPDLNVKFSAKVCTPDSVTGKTVCTIGWIGEYIAAIYKYAIGIVGILAAVVLMIGGVIWIVAGGSATMIGEAKAWIGASLAGLVIALCSYLILYQINPALTIFGPLGITQVAGTPEAAVAGASQACQKYPNPAGTNTIQYSSIKVIDKTDYPANCSAYNNAFNSFGGQKAKHLKAIAATESSCNPQAQSGVGSCGLMQLQPETAKIYDPRATSCQWLKDNPEESIKIAAQFINANSNIHGGNFTYILAGYNSGYGTTPNPVTGKKAGLAPSSDCPGYKAFECCINAGGLAETQDYVYRAIKFFHSDPY